MFLGRSAGAINKRNG